MSARLRPVLILGTSAAVALGLAGCKIDNRPLLARGAPAMDYAYAPSAAALPYAEPAQLAPASYYDGYALAQRAYAHDRVAYREPPAYGFEYGDVEPWVWQTADDDLMFAEPIDDGYRFYYYEPGEAYPYFVRDPSYGYAYGPGGVLAALFDASGALLPGDRLYSVAPVAGRYLARGRDLRQVYYREPRVAVAEPVWTRRAPALEAAQRPFVAAPPQAFKRGAPDMRDRRVAFAEPPRLEDRRFDGRRAFAPPPAFVPRGEPPHDRGLHRGERAPNVFQNAVPATARVEDRQAQRDERRRAPEPRREVARAEPPRAFERHDQGRERPAPQPQAAPAPQPQPQRQAFNGPHGGGERHQDRPAPQAAPQPAPQAPQQQHPGGGGGGDHGHHGGGNDRHDKH